MSKMSKRTKDSQSTGAAVLGSGSETREVALHSPHYGPQPTRSITTKSAPFSDEQNEKRPLASPLPDADNYPNEEYPFSRFAPSRRRPDSCSQSQSSVEDRSVRTITTRFSLEAGATAAASCMGGGQQEFKLSQLHFGMDSEDGVECAPLPTGIRMCPSADPHVSGLSPGAVVVGSSHSRRVSGTGTTGVVVTSTNGTNSAQQQLQQQSPTTRSCHNNRPGTPEPCYDHVTLVPPQPAPPLGDQQQMFAMTPMGTALLCRQKEQQKKDREQQSDRDETHQQGVGRDDGREEEDGRAGCWQQLPARHGCSKSSHGGTTRTPATPAQTTATTTTSEHEQVERRTTSSSEATTTTSGASQQQRQQQLQPLQQQQRQQRQQEKQHQQHSVSQQQQQKPPLYGSCCGGGGHSTSVISPMFPLPRGAALFDGVGAKPPHHQPQPQHRQQHRQHSATTTTTTTQQQEQQLRGRRRTNNKKGETQTKFPWEYTYKQQGGGGFAQPLLHGRRNNKGKAGYNVEQQVGDKQVDQKQGDTSRLAALGLFGAAVVLERSSVGSAGGGGEEESDDGISINPRNIGPSAILGTGTDHRTWTKSKKKKNYERGGLRLLLAFYFLRFYLFYDASKILFRRMLQAVPNNPNPGYLSWSI